jgi:hypothetical protein
LSYHRKFLWYVNMLFIEPVKSSKIQTYFFEINEYFKCSRLLKICSCNDNKIRKLEIKIKRNRWSIFQLAWTLFVSSNILWMWECTFINYNIIIFLFIRKKLVDTTICFSLGKSLLSPRGSGVPISHLVCHWHTLLAWKQKRAH